MANDDKLRADAQANKDCILDAARAALSADPEASLNSIAKAARVGAGTLYRHFPSRDALLLAVYRKEIDTLVALAPELLTKQPPLQAFRMWCDRLAKSCRMKHGIAGALHAVLSDQDFQETYWRMLDAVRQLMNACENSGDIRPGNNAEDFLTLLGLLWRIPSTPAGEARVTGLLALAFRGLGVKDTGSV